MDMEVITVGCTIHCRSWLVVMALMVGMKALPEPGISTRNFCWPPPPLEYDSACAGEPLLPRDEVSKFPG